MSIPTKIKAYWNTVGMIVYNLTTEFVGNI